MGVPLAMAQSFNFVLRNRRQQSALRYKGAAQVTTRRARRGFALRFNPDKHWSLALYRGLNYVQYADGEDILNINRDDAAGFRLDTMTTNKCDRIWENPPYGIFLEN